MLVTTEVLVQNVLVLRECLISISLLPHPNESHVIVHVDHMEIRNCFN